MQVGALLPDSEVRECRQAGTGPAVSGGTVDYSTYLLTGKASAGMEAITKMAGKQLRLIDLQGGTLDIAAAKGATLAKGGFEGSQGNFTSSHLKVVTRDPSSTRTKVSAGLNTFLASASLGIE